MGAFENGVGPLGAPDTGAARRYPHLDDAPIVDTQLFPITCRRQTGAKQLYHATSSGRGGGAYMCVGQSKSGTRACRRFRKDYGKDYT